MAGGSKISAKIAYEAIPDEYFSKSYREGKLQKIKYQSLDDTIRYAYVYVPYGYDASNIDVRYDILYIMHGAGCSAETYFGNDMCPNRYKNMLDNMIAKGDMKPVLIVAPSFYPKGKIDAGALNTGPLTRDYPTELVNALIPAVENTYHTYARRTDPRGLRESRTHRAFGGFSMGGVTTWFTFVQCLDYFFYFLPESGDCWIKGSMGGGAAPAATADALAEIVHRLGYGKADFQIYAATGTGDMAYEPLTAQIEAMKKRSDVFVYGDTASKGNLHYIVAKGQTHTCDASCAYLYDVLKLIY